MDGEVVHSHDSYFPSIFLSSHHTTMQHYTTTDLCLAAVISLYYPLAGVNPETSAFVFPCDEYIESLIDQYHRGDLTVEPRTFFTQLQELRTTLAVHRIIHW